MKYKAAIFHMLCSTTSLKIQPHVSLSRPQPLFFVPPKLLKICILCVLSVCIPLPEVPDLTGGGRLDLPHSAGTAHGSGQLGHGLRHRLLPRR